MKLWEIQEKNLETLDSSLATKVEACSRQGTELVQTPAQKALVLHCSEPLTGCQ